MMDSESIAKVSLDLAALTEKIGKKRDELRDLIGEAQSLADSLDEADENLAEAVRAGGQLTEALDAAADAMSQYA